MPDDSIDDLLPSIDVSDEFRERVRAELSVMWGGLPTPAADPSDRQHNGERQGWFVLGAAAAVVVLVLAGVTFLRGDNEGTVVVSVPPSPGVSTGATTVTPTAPSPTTPMTTLPSSDAGAPISVSFSEPPPLVEPLPLATLDAGSEAAFIGLGDGIAVVGVPWYRAADGVDRLLVVDLADGSVEELAVDHVPVSLIVGPGPVVYGEHIDEADATLVAIAIAGQRAGETLRSVPSLGHAAEPFDNAFAHGPDGIIDRWHGDALVTPYLDERGSAISVDGPWPVVPLTGVEEGTVIRSSSGAAWELAIERDPSAPSSMPNTVAAGPAGSVIVSTWIGPRIGDDVDYGTPTVPVVGVLRPDGSGSWYRLPDGWSVVDSNRWGTLVARTTDTSFELGLINPLIVSQVGWRQLAVVDGAYDDTIPRFAVDAEQLAQLAAELTVDELPPVDFSSEFVAVFTAPPLTCTAEFDMSFEGTTWSPSYAAGASSCPANAEHRSFAVALDRLAVHWPVRLLNANSVQVTLDARTGVVVDNGIEISEPPTVECATSGGYELVVTLDSLAAGPAGLSVETEGAPAGGVDVTLEGRRQTVRVPVRDDWLGMARLRVQVEGTDELGGFAIAPIGDLDQSLQDQLPVGC